MKAYGIKALMLGLLLGTGAITLAKHKDTDPSPSSTMYLKEHQDIRADLKNINAERADLADWKAELKADKKAKLKTDVIVDKKEIAKSKADLRAGKAYLMADKKDLRRDHCLAVKEERKNVAEKRTALNEAKKQLRKDLRTDNGVCINPDAASVTRLMAKYEVAKIALNTEKESFSSDMVAVNDEIQTAKANYAATVKAEKEGRAYVSK